MNSPRHNDRQAAGTDAGAHTDAAAALVRLHAESTAARRTHGEMLRILEALAAQQSGGTALLLRSALGMARRVAARLDTMGAE